MPPRHTERSTFASCIATVTGVPAVEVPLDPEELRAYLAQRGMGLVPVDDAASFAWAGPWIARRPAQRRQRPARGRHVRRPERRRSGTRRRPTDEVLDGVVVAALDVSVWEPPHARDPGDGVVEAIVLAPERRRARHAVQSAQALAGVGLEGDRYAAAPARSPPAAPAPR